MSLRDQILADIKESMKAKDSLRLGTLRTLNSEIKNFEINNRPTPMTEEDVIKVIKKAVKQRNEAIVQYQDASREDLVEKETAELKVLETYLPQQMSEDQLEPIVKDAIAEVGATSPRDMGKVMPVVIQKTAGAADNKLISEIVKRLLAN